MFSVAPNIVLAPNMTQNAERKHRTQDTNTAPIRPRFWSCSRSGFGFFIPGNKKVDILFNALSTLLTL